MKPRTDASATARAEAAPSRVPGADDVSSVRFEGLLAELSIGFVDVTAAELDAAIDHALERIVSVLDTDIGLVMETVAEGQRIRITHAYAGAGREPELPGFLEMNFPWLAEHLAGGEVTRFSRLDQLPADAAEDRHSIVRRGVQSVVTCPVVVGGTVGGAVAFASIGRERHWPDAFVDRLRLVGRMFAGALARRRVEERLAEEREFAEAVTESLPGMFFMGDERNRFVRWNKNRELVTGDSAEELRGQHLSKIFDAENVPRIQTALDEAWRDGSGVSQHDVVTKDGRRIPYVFIARIVTIAARSYVMAMGMDVSALKTAEEQIRRQQSELAHVARVSALGELVAAIAHELNQPLTAIRTNAQATRRMLAGGGVDPAEFDEALADITSDAGRAGEIIRRLHDLLRKGSAERLSLDVNEIVRGVEPLARVDVLEHNAVLVMQLAAHLPSVIGDRIQLQQVVLNLIRNAADAMRDAARREIVVSTASVGPETIEVTVRDHGPSLSDDEFGRMFQPFYTTKPGGLGIGLSLSRSIIEAHGGLMWATRDELESGITMHVTLPIDPTATR